MKENLPPHYSENNLRIRIYPDGMHYVVTADNEKVVLQQTIDMPAEKLKDSPFLHRFFEQPELRILSENVSVVLENSHYQLVPNALFRREEVHFLYELEFGKSEQIRLGFHLLPQWGAHLVYGIEKSIAEFLETKYPEADVAHHVFHLLQKKVGKNGDGVFVHVRKNAVDVLVVKDSKLLLVNSFEVKTAEDICYFVLNAYEQLALDVYSFPLQVLSQDKENQELMLLLKQYITHVEEENHNL